MYIINSQQVKYLFWIGLFLGFSLQIVRISSLNTISHDEAISYLSATGHEKTYAFDQPANQWVEAKKWKKYWKIDNTFCFGQIGRDLAMYDIHPPLYFWTLHIWLVIIGVSIWSGPILNLIFFLISYLLLVIIAKNSFNDELFAAILCITWAVSPAVYDVTAVVRQYSLLTLSSIFYCFILTRLTIQIKLFSISSVSYFLQPLDY